MARRATIKDVARAAEVSTVTVSRVVNTPALVQPATRARVEQSMRALGYVPNLAAQAMRTNLTRSIGFLVPDLTNYPNAAVAQAAETVLAAEGYCMLLTASDYRVERELRALEVLESRQVDGMILYFCDELDERLHRALARLTTPVVVLDRAMPVANDTVLSEHEAPILETARYLAALGHRRIAMVQTDLEIRPNHERRRAMAAAIAALGLDPSDLVLLRLPPEPASALPRLLALLDGAERPTALLVDGSRLLRLVIQAARLRRLEIPADLSVIGVDAADIASAATPEITCIVRDFAAIGRAAAELILGRLRHQGPLPPRQIVLEGSVVLKGSCAAPAA
jgi:DNA-binding LacI/PurR family transcriptional regulator